LTGAPHQGLVSPHHSKIPTGGYETGAHNFVATYKQGKSGDGKGK